MIKEMKATASPKSLKNYIAVLQTTIYSHLNKNMSQKKIRRVFSMKHPAAPSHYPSSIPRQHILLMLYAFFVYLVPLQCFCFRLQRSCYVASMSVIRVCHGDKSCTSSVCENIPRCFGGVRIICNYATRPSDIMDKIR